MNLVYIDDEQDGINSFRRSFLLQNQDAIIRGIQPQYTLEETYNLLFVEGEIEAVITDYELSDSCDVSFTGAELVQFILSKHPLLPCFVLTAFEDKAVKSDAVDVYQVYPKSILDDSANSEHEVSFYDRVSQQIDKNKRKLIAIQKEHADLLSQKGSSEWTSEKEDRLIYCDDILEHHYSGEKISSVLKKNDYSQKIVELIDVTKNLLEEVKRNEADS